MANKQEIFEQFMNKAPDMKSELPSRIGLDATQPKQPRQSKLHDFTTQLPMKEIIGDDKLLFLSFPNDIPPQLAATILKECNALVMPVKNSTSKRILQEMHYADIPYIYAVKKSDMDKFISDKAEDVLSGYSNINKVCSCYPLHDDLYVAAMMVYDETIYLWKNETHFPAHQSYIKNFLYLLYPDTMLTDEQIQKQAPEQQIFSYLAQQYFQDFENAENETQAEHAILKMSTNLPVGTSYFKAADHKFTRVLGILKNSKPLSMPVFTKDDLDTDFFKLDKSRQHHIMHGIYINKTNESFDFSNIDIHGDFLCSRAKGNIILPNSISHVWDCSYCSGINFTPETRLPLGFQAVDFTGTIKDFDILISLQWPASVEKILVSNSVINAVLKDEDLLDKAAIFFAEHPGIEIFSGPNKPSLFEQMMQQISDKQFNQKKTVSPEPKAPVSTVAHKTPEWLNRKEILAALLADSRFANIQEDLEKPIKRAINTNTEIKSQQMLDGKNKVICVHIESLELLKTTVLQIIANDKTFVPEKEPIVHEVKQPEQPVQPKHQSQPVAIEKYFLKSVWKKICKYCGDSSQVLYSVLETTNLINQLYIYQKSTDPVLYLNENNVLQPVPGTYVKTGKAAAQRIGNDNGTRIVWTLNPDDKIMVAIAFYDDHTPGTRQKQSYDDVAIPAAARGCLLNGKTKVNAALVKQGNYLNIRDLMDEYKPTQKDKQEPVAKTKQETKPKKAEKVAKKTVSTQPADSKPAIEKATKEKKIEPIEQKPIEPQPLQKIDLSQIEKMSREPVERKRRVRRTKSGPADIESIGIMLEDITYSIDKEIRQDARDLVNFSNIPENQLKIAKHILELVNKKITLLGK